MKNIDIEKLLHNPATFFDLPRGGGLEGIAIIDRNHQIRIGIGVKQQVWKYGQVMRVDWIDKKINSTYTMEQALIDLKNQKTGLCLAGKHYALTPDLKLSKEDLLDYEKLLIERKFIDPPEVKKKAG